MTNMMPAEEQVLKSDSKGRIQTPPQRRERLLDEFERSGLSGKKFSALVGVPAGAGHADGRGGFARG